jgi:hypothetical protein
VTWRNFYIVTRPHPMALSSYSAVDFLGGGFIFQQLHSASVSAALSHPLVRLIWELMMLIGGLLAFAGASMKRLSPGLLLEISGCLISGFGLLTYASSVITEAGWSQPGWVVVTALAVGCFARALQAQRNLLMLPVLAAHAAKLRAIEESLDSELGDWRTGRRVK